MGVAFFSPHPYFLLGGHFQFRERARVVLLFFAVLGRDRRGQTFFVLLSEVVGGRGAERTHRNLGMVPVAVLLQGVEDLLGIGVDQVGPGFPKRVDDVVHETDLKKSFDESGIKFLA